MHKRLTHSISYLLKNRKKEKLNSLILCNVAVVVVVDVAKKQKFTLYHPKDNFSILFLFFLFTM